MHDWIAEHALDWLPAEAKQWITANRNWHLYGTAPVALKAEFARAFDFTVSVDPNAIRVYRGSEASAEVCVEGSGELPKKVTLSVSAPEGISAKVLLESCVPPFNTSLVVNASQTVKAGKYTLTLTATCGGVVKAVDVWVIVEEHEKPFYEQPWTFVAVAVIAMALAAAYLLLRRHR